jgi:hypothetical protein
VSVGGQLIVKSVGVSAALVGAAYKEFAESEGAPRRFDGDVRVGGVFWLTQPSPRAQRKDVMHRTMLSLITHADRPLAPLVRRRHLPQTRRARRASSGTSFLGARSFQGHPRRLGRCELSLMGAAGAAGCVRHNTDCRASSRTSWQSISAIKADLARTALATGNVGAPRGRFA